MDAQQGHNEAQCLGDKGFAHEIKTLQAWTNLTQPHIFVSCESEQGPCLGMQEAANLEKAEAAKRAADKAAKLALPHPDELKSLLSLKRMAKEAIKLVINMQRAVDNVPRVDGNVSIQSFAAQTHAGCARTLVSSMCFVQKMCISCIWQFLKHFANAIPNFQNCCTWPDRHCSADRTNNCQ